MGPEYFPKDYSLSSSTYSIKNIVTPLSPSFSYNDLDGVSNGMAAVEAFYRIMHREFKEGETAVGHY